MSVTHSRLNVKIREGKIVRSLGLLKKINPLVEVEIGKQKLRSRTAKKMDKSPNWRG